MAVVATLLRLRLGASNRKGVLSLLAVSVLATVGVVAGLAVRSGTSGRVDVLYAASGKPDLVVIGGPNSVPPAIERAKQAGLIEAATIYQAAFGSLERPDGTGVGIAFVATGDFANVEVGSPILSTGRWPERADELALDTGAAVAHGYYVGATVSIERNGISTVLTVVGTAVDMTECFYPACSPLRGYVTPAGLLHISPEGPYARAHARLADGLDETVAAETIRGYERVSSVNTWSTNRTQILLAGNVFSAFVASFGAFVLVATLLVVASTAVGAIVSRRRELGLLKALGATSRQLMVVMVLEHVVVGLFGVVLGWILGSILAPWLQLGLVEVIGRSSPDFDTGSLLAVAAMMATVLVLSTVVPARRGGSLTARSALADAPSQSAGGQRVRRFIYELPLSPPSVLGMQLAVARPVRAALAATAVAVAVAGGLAGWRLSDGVNTMIAEPGRAGDPYDVLVATSPSYPTEQIDQILAQVSGVKDWYIEDATTVQLDGSDVGLRGIGHSVDSAALAVVDGAMPASPGQALAGWGLFRDGELSIGDTVTLHHGTERFAVTIVGRHGDLDHAGRAVVVSLTDYEEFVGLSRPHWRVAGDGSLDSTALALVLDEAFDGQVVVQPATSLSQQLRPFQIVLGLLVLLVSLVAASNLGATLVATGRERRRELGVVRSLGFSDGELRRQAASGGVMLGLVGVAFGVPVGLVASRVVIERAADEIGLGPGLIQPGWIGISAVAGVLGVCVSGTVSVVSARSLRVIPASELVASVDS